MRRLQLLEASMKHIAGLLSDKDLGNEARNPDSSAFTRNRRLGCGRLLFMILRGLRSQLQKAADYLFEELEMGESVTRQAVSKARQRIDPNFIRRTLRETSASMCACEDLVLFGKYRLCAIDGSGVSVRNCLKDIFGDSNGQATALMSLAYDPLNDVIMDATLGKWNGKGVGERIAALANIEICEEISHQIPNLYIFDRGYGSHKFIGGLMDSGGKFLTRVRGGKTGFCIGYLNEGEVDGWHSLDYEENCHRVRVMKIALNTGEIETLVTNLTEDEFPYEQAGELYFSRWSIEVKIAELKEKLALERMRGRLETTVLQDFYATMWLSNIAAIARWSTEAVIAEKDSKKTLKHKRKTDVNRLLLKLRGRLYAIITERSDIKRNKMLAVLVKDVARFPVDIVPMRSSERKSFVRKHPCTVKNSAVD
jgi:hypothetical protein